MAGPRRSALARQAVRAVGACRAASAVPPRRAGALQNFTLCAACKLHSMCSSVQGAVMLDSVEEPRNARSRRTRAALLDATRALLEEHGTEWLTMAAVAERAGVSRRAVYLHFASRAELLTELFGHVSERSEEHTSELQSRGHLVCRLLPEQKNCNCASVTWRFATTVSGRGRTLPTDIGASFGSLRTGKGLPSASASSWKPQV